MIDATQMKALFPNMKNVRGAKAKRSIDHSLVVFVVLSHFGQELSIAIPEGKTGLPWHQ